MLRTRNLGALSFIVLSVLSVLSLAACSSGSSSSSSTPTVVTDTRGTKFSESCSSSICTYTAQDPSIKPVSCDSAYGSDAFVILWSRVLMIHVLNIPSSGGNPQASAAEPGHPVACTTVDDCTPWNATFSGVQYQFTCQNGICQDPTKALTANDVITLCQADIPWPSSCPYVASSPFANRLAEIAVTCPSSTQCEVPADCWQPTATVDAGVSAADSGAAAADSGVGAVDSGESAADLGG